MTSGLDLLVSYAKSEGALAEALPEGALLVLPDPLQQDLELDEEVVLTEDPEAAREDGFVLLFAGHPLVVRAAQAVLDRGDVGCAQLNRPAGPPPGPRVLEQRAREQLHVEHGRIDVTGAPNLTAVAVLRVGALVTYRVAIDERAQEIEEVWVEASSGEPLPDELRSRVQAAASEPEPPRRVAPGAALEPGLAGARAQLRARAQYRAAQLAQHASARLKRQLEAVDDYYHRVIASCEERRRRAPEDRARILSAQIDATHDEWSRRRAEVADDLTPSVELRPFRLHLLSVPAYELQAVVRRGAKVHPVPLTYVPLTASFLAPRCPSCGGSGSLVAGKDRLGCKACLRADPALNKRPDAPTSNDSPAAPTSNESAPPYGATSPPAAPTPPPAATPTPPRQEPPRGVRRPASTGRTTPKGARTAGGLARAGNRIAIEFWESVLGGGRLRARDIVANSPLAALLRLYGTRGPALLVGMRDGEEAESVHAATDAASPTAWVLTSGALATSMGRELAFALYWRAGSRMLAELEAFPLDVVAPMLIRSDEVGRRFRHRFDALLGRPPGPQADLASPEVALLEHATRRAGLAYAARCFAAWWYVTETAGAGASAGRNGASPCSAAAADLVTAAALESIVAKRAGLRIAPDAIAELYGCPAEDVRAEARRLRAVVRNCPDARW